MSQSQPITMELEEEQASLDRHLTSGEFQTPSEVLRAGRRALDWEQEAVLQTMREKIREAFEDPRPDIPAEEVFRELRKRHAKQ